MVVCEYCISYYCYIQYLVLFLFVAHGINLLKKTIIWLMIPVNRHLVLLDITMSQFFW